MTVICTYHADQLRTPHDGDLAEVDIEVYDPGYPHRLVARADAVGDLAYLDVKSHRLWAMNPGLLNSLHDRVRAMTLVKG